MMRNIKITIEYDGSAFNGWQVQKGTPCRTVQGDIEKALKIIFKKNIRVQGSGRTDTGVHAEGQVANFKIASSIPAEEIVRALNGNLSQQVAVLTAEDVPLNFHAQYSAKRKTYCYTIFNRAVRGPLAARTALFFSQPLNVRRMRAAARVLTGRHDFRCFMAADPAKRPLKNSKNTVRLVSRLEVKKRGDILTVTIEANGFLYKMVRNIVGTLLAVGSGRLSLEEVALILNGRDRTRAPETAPAHGLCLKQVRY